MNRRRLYRSRTDRKLAGVAGGVAEYLDIDPTIVRVLWVLSVFLGGFSILVYIVMAFVMPLEPEAGWAPAPRQPVPGSGQPTSAPPTGAATPGVAPTSAPPTGAATPGAAPTAEPTTGEGEGATQTIGGTPEGETTGEDGTEDDSPANPADAATDKGPGSTRHNTADR